MNKTHHRPQTGRIIIITVLVIYIIAIIYFMFFGFDRPHFGSTHQEYRFELIPTGIPLWFPKSLENMDLWIFSLGNLLAFVPFGILIPIIFDFRYRKLILIFTVSILSLEVLQMITFLGSFDTADIITNAIGVSIGFISYNLCRKLKSLPLRIAGVVLLTLIFAFIAIALAELLNKVIS